ncbi:hypothetical protein MF406_16260 [Georgenia sp. TF02-10]|uniref:hypothetical protein n=1 Tax=Georgenia sp. TF02-10 TaxID=2917725 RepID=UPI001FA6C3C5|nr:hypothetical protein [Georgenia sp. TF02-10]UNX54433.1 hypothetical protein MF406_16260 [Georgenia sp. TF02-10]
MTANRSFERLVRARMGKTGESYTAARAVLLAATELPGGDGAPALATSERTGRGWEEWFDLLDDEVADKPHREIARWLADLLELHPLAWNVQAIAGSYERARPGRAVGEHADGFSVSASRTIAVPVEELFEAFVDPSARERWIPGVTLAERKATPPTAAHFDWADG